MGDTRTSAGLDRPHPVIHACPKHGFRVNARNNIYRCNYPQGFKPQQLQVRRDSLHLSEFIAIGAAPLYLLAINTDDLRAYQQATWSPEIEVSQLVSLYRSRLSSVSQDGFDADLASPMLHGTQRSDSTGCDVDLSARETFGHDLAGRIYMSSDSGATEFGTQYLQPSQYREDNLHDDYNRE